MCGQGGATHRPNTNAMQHLWQEICRIALFVKRTAWLLTSNRLGPCAERLLTATNAVGWLQRGCYNEATHVVAAEAFCKA
jgi:hypothetical protein